MPPVLFTHELLVEMLTGHPTGHLDPFPASVPPAPPASSASNNMFLLWRRQTAYFDGGSDDKDAMAAAATERGAYGGVDGGGGGYYGGGGGPYLSTGAIVGIVLGCIFCLMILVWIFWCCASLGGRRRNRGCDDRRYRRRRDGSACSYVRSRPRYERGRTLVVENSVCRPEPAVCNGGCRGCKYY
ncbi:hypothetical protein PG993_010400 [Apiospora rasikravindrae]|uniref:Uncharacterized protein n=1 Tax=Apiospora rasikravindrae TaxID=990691 RepID=A0ABR1SNY5_9PEZI